MTSKTICTLCLTTLAALTLGGCAVMSNSTPDNYQDEDYAAYAAQRNGTALAMDELGWPQTKTLSDDDRRTLETRIELNRLERNIPTQRERQQYYSYKPYFQTDEDRVAFLELPTMDARERFANQKGVTLHSDHYSPQVKSAISRSDIVLGMTKDAVIASWGEPGDVEVAGNPMYENERWSYTEYVTNPDGYRREDRVIFFESGRVAGWQRQDENPEVTAAAEAPQEQAPQE